MHSSNFNSDDSNRSRADVLVALTALVTEGRIPGKLNSKSKGFYEGPHCTLNKSSQEHQCNFNDNLCVRYENIRDEVVKLWLNSIPLCIEVILTCGCKNDENLTADSLEHGFLLEQWHFTINHKRSSESPEFKTFQLVNAIRSQLYFSQITAWLSTQDDNNLPTKLTDKNIHYRLAFPGETVETSKFSASSVEHKFPATDIGNNLTLNISFFSLPRMSQMPEFRCPMCKPKSVSDKTRDLKTRDLTPPQTSSSERDKKGLFDDSMHVVCTLKGKHHCEDYEETDNLVKSHGFAKIKRLRQNASSSTSVDYCQPSTSSSNPRLSPKLPTIHFRNLNLNEHHELVKEKRHISPNCEHLNKFARWDDEGANPNKSKSQCHDTNDLKTDSTEKNKGQILLDAIERTAQKIGTPEKCSKKKGDRHSDGDDDNTFIAPSGRANRSECDNASCDTSDNSDIFRRKDKKTKFNIYVDKKCDSTVVSSIDPNKEDVIDKPIISHNINSKSSFKFNRSSIRQKLTFDNDDADSSGCGKCDSQTRPQTEVNGSRKIIVKDANNVGGAIGIPTASEQAKFRKNLDNAASMVFHSRTGLPLTSSPAPVRRGKNCFDYDSSINSVSAIKSALFSTSFSTDDESESDGSLVSPCSPEIFNIVKREPSPVKHRRKGHAANLLGSFEESVLNGRLEPVSTVHGFTAELGASGSFVPKHLIVPVTVFFYTLGDNDKVSSPYLGHINLGKKGYNIPRIGTVQVTLFNPLGTVVKMFVIMYDLSDMPPNSQTFLRQRTLYMPTHCKDQNLEWGPKWLRYLIHLRFMSSKSGKVYLHSDIRMIIFRKSDLDTATAHGLDMSYELRSFVQTPTNPRFSPRK